MNRLSRFLDSSIGAKLLMAVTGLLLAMFTVGHLSGNFLIFKGRAAMNDYAEFLQGLGAVLWLVRGGLLLIFVAHVAVGIKLARLDRAARPSRYVKETTVKASLASRTMIYTGLLVLFYLMLHLAHFTLGWTSPETSAHALTETLVRGGVEISRPDVYGMVISDFGKPVYLIVYVLAMAVLGLHLSHGLHSLFQTLGLRHKVYTPIIETLGKLIAWVIAVGYMTIPIAIKFGLIGKEVTN